MALLFDGHCRAKAFLELLAIPREELANQELVDQLSEEFKAAIDPTRLAE